MRTALIAAIAACTEGSLRKDARKFLRGLSRDELQYIAEFMGACILESLDHAAHSRNELADGIAQFEKVREDCTWRPGDREHKMILLLEYLCRCNFAQPT